MKNRLIPIYYHVHTGVLYGSNGVLANKTAYPFMYFMEKPMINLTLIDSIDSNNNITPYTDFEGTETFKAVIDNDWDHSSDPMVRTFNTDFNQAGDWRISDDSGISQANPSTYGTLSFPLNGNTTSFQSAISGKSKAADNPSLEIYVYDGTTLLATYSIPFVCYNVRDIGDDPLESTSSQFSNEIRNGMPAVVIYDINGDELLVIQ